MEDGAQADNLPFAFSIFNFAFTSAIFVTSISFRVLTQPFIHFLLGRLAL